MKIFLAIMRSDYGDPTRGPSYEEVNFHEVLRRDGHDVRVFDYMAELADGDIEAMNSRMVAACAEFRPAVAMFSLFTDQVLPATMARIREISPTFAFFHDDTWRVDFSREWAARVDWFSSPDIDCKRKYPAIGLPNVFYFPFGANEMAFRPLDKAKRFDIAFVGGWHPYRAWLLKRLERAGLPVEVRGAGWPKGMVSHDEMVELFNETRINLNLSNSTSWDARYLASSLRAVRGRLRSTKHGEQMKARVFEINACRAFQLSYYVDGLEHCYSLGDEMMVYLDPEDLVDKVRRYLGEPDLCDRIAAAGYARTLRDHRYSDRFARLFAAMGLAA